MNIWNILDTYMTKEPYIRDQRWVNLYPSEASIRVTNQWGEQETQGTCQRRAWLRYKVAEDLNRNLGTDIATIQIGNDIVAVMPEPPDPRREWIFEEGRRIESTILDVARSAGVFELGHRKFNIPVDKETNLVGETDGLLKIEDEYLGVEIKSTSGYNAEREVYGTAKTRHLGGKGDPKIQHLLQTAIYTWHYRFKLPCFKILYFHRGSCLRTEFLVTIDEDSETGTCRILVDNKDTDITIENILDRYRELSFKLKNDIFPDREFTLSYNDEQMNKLLARDKLSRTLKTQWEKYWDRKQNGGRQVKRPEHGDFACIFCPYKGVCYDKQKSPIEYDTILHADVASETDDNDGDGHGDCRGSSGDIRPESKDMDRSTDDVPAKEPQPSDDKVSGS